MYRLSIVLAIACLWIVKSSEWESESEFGASNPFSELQRDLLATGEGASCSASGQKGSCLDNRRADCDGGRWQSGLCPGGSNIRCCFQPCRSGSGQCMPTRDCRGSTVSNLCDGPYNVKCCRSSSGGGTGGGNTGSCSPIRSLPSTPYDAYQGGNRIGTVQVIMYPGTNKRVEVTTACAVYKMSAAARRDGIRLVINSGFRTMAEQEYFWNCYVNQNCNNGNLAARPGRSNHQNGKAVDFSTHGGAYNWLARNGHDFGFVRTVCSETWHWEYRPGTSKNAFCRY